MDIFSNIEKRTKELSENWEKLEGLSNILATKVPTNETEEIMIKMLLLIVKQMKPIGNATDVKEATKDIESMLVNLTKRANKR